MKRFIDIHVPVTTCNLHCHYCYVMQENMRGAKPTPFSYSPEYIGRALSVKRLGGLCHFNMCGLGETLIPPQIVDIIDQILRQGHYIMVVTNGLLTERFREVETKVPPERRKRLGFKFSFHYLELIRTGQLARFFENVRYARKIGCSISVEVTPNDELEPYIGELQRITRQEAGALCHLTVPRTEDDAAIPLLSKHSSEEFRRIWSVFGSALFDFKFSTWGIKRKEYCYAGMWSGLLNIGDGTFESCYGQRIIQNIFQNLDRPIEFVPVGCHCKMPHCYNSHSFLTLGDIPELPACTYAEVRNRVCADGTEWLTPEMKAFLSQKLVDANGESGRAKKAISTLQKYRVYGREGVRKVFRKLRLTK